MKAYVLIKTSANLDLGVLKKIQDLPMVTEVHRLFGIYDIIAEIGSNHNGDMNLARVMIDSAVKCGCNAVKFQSWTPNSLIAEEEYNRNTKYIDNPRKHWGSLREMVEKYYLRNEQHRDLKEYCDTIGIDFCSTPFSTEEADLLTALDVPFYKIASMDINNHRLLIPYHQE